MPLRKQNSFEILIFLSVVVLRTNSQSCPNNYLRFTQDHSYCKPLNPKCTFLKRGLDGPKEIALILRLHNSYRSRLAMGHEHLAGGMPQAANMMQMEWDNELASVAQKWAENCIYEHDCRHCRQVENFPVGQNIAYKDFWCSFSNCIHSEEEDIPAWEEIIKIFYDEVIDFDHKYVNAFQNIPTKEIGHFTQMIWGNTWRIGCGYTLFNHGKGKRHFFVCNYGPSGNMINMPIYQQGSPCSACPYNTCCGETCKGEHKYPGLCKMLDTETAPVYLQKNKGLIYSCDFQKFNSDCRATYSGHGNWRTKYTLSGNIASVQLSPGEETHMHFTSELRPQNAFCFRMQFRKGAVEAGRSDQSILSVTFDEKYGSGLTMKIDFTDNEICPYSLDLSGFPETKFTINYKVPSNSYPHILDIKDIVVFNGECSKRKTDYQLGYQA